MEKWKKKYTNKQTKKKLYACLLNAAVGVHQSVREMFENKRIQVMTHYCYSDTRTAESSCCV